MRIIWSTVSLAAWAAGLLLAVCAGEPAQARVFFSFGIPFPVVVPPPVYYPPVYAPAPAYYYYPPYRPVPAPGPRCFASGYICPLHAPLPVGTTCACPGPGGSRVLGSVN